MARQISVRPGVLSTPGVISENQPTLHLNHDVITFWDATSGDSRTHEHDSLTLIILPMVALSRPFARVPVRCGHAKFPQRAGCEPQLE